MTYNPTKVAFVDTETTGLDPDRHSIWEVAVILPDSGDEVVWQQRWHSRTAESIPWRNVDPWVLENTGIQERYDPETAIDPHPGGLRFGRLVEGRHLVGACPWFDSERLHKLWRTSPHQRQRQHPWHYHLIDVETLAVGAIWSGLNRPSLPWDSSAISRSVGVDPADFEPKHSALADARWARAVFEAVVGRPGSP